MSDKKQPDRVVLGPVARDLIEGHERNRPKALDEAISALIEAAGEAPAAPPAPEPTGDAIPALLASIEAQTEALKQLAYVCAFEQKMTRVLIATLMSDTNEDLKPSWHSPIRRSRKSMQNPKSLATTSNRNYGIQRRRCKPDCSGIWSAAAWNRNTRPRRRLSGD